MVRTKLRHSLGLIACFAAAILAPAEIRAGPLAVKKPSQLVVLSALAGGLPLTPCQVGSLSGVALDKQIGSDGSASLFDVPADRVLVVYRLTWSAPETAGTVFLGTAAQSLWFLTPPPPNAQGLVGTTVELPNLIVRAGQKLCVATVDHSIAGGVVAGFVTKDR
jgi:hypothetical protein